MSQVSLFCAYEYAMMQLDGGSGYHKINIFNYSVKYLKEKQAYPDFSIEISTIMQAEIRLATGCKDGAKNKTKKSSTSSWSSTLVELLSKRRP